MAAAPWLQYAKPDTQGAPWEQYAKPVDQPSAPPEQPGMFAKMKDNFNAATQGAKPGDGALKSFVEDVGAGGGDIIRAAAHPLRTIGAMVSTPDPMLQYFAGDKDAVTKEAQTMPSFARSVGQAGTGAILGDLAGEGVGMAATGAKKLGGMARTAAIGDPDAAALRGLQVGARSPKTLSTLNSVEGARPYLAGAKNLEDLQSKIQPAKDEIFSEYNKAVQGIGDRPVKGPDGMTTVRDLENQRLQLSALNRGLRTNNPEALQLAQQKGMSSAELLAKEDAVKQALDPELASTGIDPQAIRKTFGNVAQVGSRMSGKSTLIEKPQPYGLGKLASSVQGIDIAKPTTYLNPIKGVWDAGKDITAGRPLFSGKPTDVALKDAFSGSAPKPNLGKFQMPTVKGLLQAPMEDIPLHDPFSEPASPKMGFDAPVMGGRYPAGQAPPSYFRYGDQPAEMPEGATGVNQQGVLRRRMSQ